MRRRSRRPRYGAHRLRPRRIPLAELAAERRTAEMNRLPPMLLAWLEEVGARLVPPTLDAPTWRVRLGARVAAHATTAHNAIRAAQATLARTPLDALPHVGA